MLYCLQTLFRTSNTVSPSSNSTVTSSSANGASVNGSEVIISKEGTYILTGKASDGAVIVDAGDNDKIQLVFDNIENTSFHF